MTASPNTLTILPLSPAEHSTQLLSPRSLQHALEALHRDGIVVLSNAVSHGSIDALEARMLSDVDVLRKKDGDAMPYNYNRGNVQQDPPPVVEYLKKDVFMNPFAAHLATHYLGPTPHLRFNSGNTALFSPEGARQPVHTDADFDHPKIPFAVVVNVPLVTMTPENGSTELWLGTHTFTTLSHQEGAHGDRASGRIVESGLKERRSAGIGPIQGTIPKGSIIIRDLRLWHAGLPNHTHAPRIMLAQILFASWYRNKMSITLPLAAKEMVEGWERETGVRVEAEWVEGDGEGYLERARFGNDYDFDQEA
ncbi:phytanoyl-CoA dioxygenase [Saitoella complicata NRRL Y-17804]|uniref:Phytanoyl-CoA dioxygenase n=1 Tax=Saitoella complicata (strain BCRC 22490 / CBS 7301 / JCM 7358 / NBRC 10748 / NRRL Y-17804) TaxID=698492 RepID=A0A0E9NTT1_SAICN|nr:phytanoyl-CoA dioxygenase [Saitoella complicata NRRL Y-17804]ODQ49757.1 phytanoyl-CoA dioxygenase [Saitoella complicata NRRL Y-17804]GAO52820.1 hypothetical protein G7K_6887-t1 [Saitoella complicata NRRL Y-17804]